MEEDYKLFQLIRRDPINNCVDLSKNMIGKRSGFIYFTENLRIDFENKMANQARLQEENERLQKENEELLEVKVSASAHNRILELEKENEELKEYKRKNEQNSLEFDVDGDDGDWAELKRILNESRKTNEYITYKGEKWIKEKYCIPIQKLKDIIEKISLYKKLAKESIGQRIVIADSDSLEYGRMEAHNADMSLLQELLESEETNDKNNKKG